MTPRVALLSATVVLCSVVAASPLFGQPPVQPLALVNEARAASLQGQQDEAIALYREALMRAPGLYEAYYGLGIAFDLAERFAEARDAFIRAIQVAPDGSTEQALTGIAVSFVFSGDRRQAASFFQQVYDRQIDAANLAAASETATALARVSAAFGDSDNEGKWNQAAQETSRRALPAAQRPPAAAPDAHSLDAAIAYLSARRRNSPEKRQNNE